MYVQPQWVFDCINENMLLPVDEYLPGAILPPHLSPFVEEGQGGYVPPEKKRLIKMKLGIAEEPQKAEIQQVEKVQLETLNEEKTKNVKNDSQETKIEPKEPAAKKLNQEEDEDDEEKEDEEMHGMRVDLESPDEESESEEEVIEESDEEEKLKKKTQVRIERLN